MKKFLFISNTTNKISNFTIPSINAATNLGYEFHMAANYKGFQGDPNKYGVTLHHLDIGRNPFSLQNIQAYRQLLHLIKKENIDVIHCNTPIGGVLGRLVGRRLRVSKVIYTAHGFHFYRGAPLINNTLFKWAEMWLAHYTDTIITINNEDYEAANKFKLRNNGKVYYVPGVGIDTLEIKYIQSNREKLLKEIGGNKESVIVVSVGELNDNKNNKLIIKALGELMDPNIHYVLCGEGEKKKELKKLSEEMRLNKNIHFLGFRTDVSQLLKSSDVFVMPSHREGLSRALMEAMAAGLPCVVSKIRGNVDLIEDGMGGYLHEADDFKSFAESINILALDKSLRERMKLSNLKTIQKYDTENIKKEMLDIYTEELGGKHV